MIIIIFRNVAFNRMTYFILLFYSYFISVAKFSVEEKSCLFLLTSTQSLKKFVPRLKIQNPQSTSTRLFDVCANIRKLTFCSEK